MFAKRIKSHHSGHPKRSTFSSQSELFSYLNENLPTQKEGVIYIHVPFCDNICSFCSMNRTKLDSELDEYVDYLLDEIASYSKLFYFGQKSFESVYFGGGTPTILKERHLEEIITALHDSFKISPTCEFNFESTLHNLGLSKLKLLQSLGVNRFSIGIQTFSQNGRKLLNRVHNSKQAVEHLIKLRENFSDLLCADIIYNYPNQSIDEVVTDAKILKDIGVDSVSFYSLIFFEGSEFAKIHTSEYYDLETDKRLHHAFIDEMLKGDYEFLELTKINKLDRDSYKYIRLSHAGVDVLPIGIGAGGRVGEFGIYNMKKNMKMIGILPKVEIDYQKFVALFQYPNVKFSDIKGYLSQDGFNELENFLKKCESNRLLTINESGFSLNKDGIFWGNSMAEEIAKLIYKEFE